MPIINGVYLKDFTALPGAVADANIIPIAITGDLIAYRTTVSAIVTDARVTSKLLTGLSITGSAVLATDTILQAFGKVQNQLNGKQGTITLTTTGTSNPATLIGSTLNIPNYGSALTAYVPYTGATTDVDLGVFKLNAQSLHVKGTAGNGHLGLKHQSASATASANESSLFADSNGDMSFQNANLYLNKFVTSSNSANRTYTFPDATGTVALVGGSGVGTVTSVAALTLGTTGTDLSSTVANGTTTPVITLNVPTASATNRGALSSADWSTFNGKQGAITLTTTGTSNAATLIGNTLNIPIYSTDLSGYVPYTGANQTLQMGTNNGITLTDTGTNVSITITSTSTGQGAFVINKSVNGSGVVVNNSGIGFGIYANNTSTGSGIAIGNSSTGKGLYIDNAASATGDPFAYSLNGVANIKAKIDYIGNITGQSFIPSGATVPTNGMYLSAANTLDFATNSTNRLSIASTGAATFSGNIGVGGGTPSIFTAYSIASFGSLSTTTNGITIASTTAGNGIIEFADGVTGNQAYRGYIQYAHTTDSFIFATAGSDRLTITSGGNVEIRSAGQLIAYRSDNNRSGAFYTDNLAVHITSTNDPIRLTSADRIDFYTSATERVRIASTGVVTISNLAGSGSRTVTADSSGVLSAASDSRLKQEDLGHKIEGLSEILKIQPRAYKWLSDIENKGENATTEIGFFANEVSEIIPSAAPKGNDGYYGFYDRAIIAALVKSVQELKAEIDILKNK